MGVIEGAIAEVLHTIGREAIGGGWGITAPDENETDIWIILRKGQDPSDPEAPIQIALNYFKSKGIVYVTYEAWSSGDDPEDLSGLETLFHLEVPIADPKSLQKIEATVKEYVKRANMGVGA